MTSPAKHIYSSSMEFNKGKLVNICINKSLSNDYNSKNKVKTTCKKNNNINKDIKNEKYLLNKSTLGSTTRNNNSIKKFDKNFTLNNYKKQQN